MKNKITIDFILPTLFAGGAERVISFISQNLDKNKFDVTLIVIGFEKDRKFDVNQIPVIYLNKNRISFAVLSIVNLFRERKPDVVVSSISHLNAMMGIISIIFPKIKFIGRHATISNVAKNYRIQKRKLNIASLFNLYNFGLKKLDFIICQSSDMKTDFLKSYKINERKVKIIHNPVTQVKFLKNQNQTDGIRRFITIGRLSKIKGQLRLLNVLSKLTTPFEFTIIGDGSYYDLIMKKIEDLNLTNNVKHIKHTDNVFQFLVKSDMFLQGSYSEGFPNALLESCTVGVPVIAFNAPGGTKEIVKDGINGFLVNDEDEFLEKLQDNREWNPKEIRNYVLNKFNKEKILKQYETLFFEILNQN